MQVRVDGLARPCTFLLEEGSRSHARGLLARSATLIAPDVTLVRGEEWEVPADPQAREGAVVAYSVELALPETGLYSTVWTSKSGRPLHLTIRSGAEWTEKGVLDALACVVSSLGTPTTLRSEVKPAHMSALRQLMPRAVDVLRVPPGCLFTAKADGERFLAIRCGCLWLFTRRTSTWDVTGSVVSSAFREYSNVGPALDLEVMTSSTYVLIDILMGSSGNLAPLSRPISKLADRLESLGELGIDVLVREYFPSATEATRYSLECGFPTDGLVAVTQDTGITVKVKDVKSIELKVNGRYELETEDGHVLVREVSEDLAFETGDIVELRVRVARGGGGGGLPSVEVLEVFHRPDKTLANDAAACLAVLQSAAGEEGDPLAIGRAEAVCAELKRVIYSAAAGRGGSRVILDLGAGRGQSLPQYASLDSKGRSPVRYLHVEPSPENSQMLVRALTGGGRRVAHAKLGDPSLTGTLGALQKGSISHVVLECTAAELLQDREVARRVRRMISAAVAAFSVTYVADEMAAISDWGVSVIGCGYLYDDADSDGVLVDCSGVSMKIEGDGLATVRWPGATTIRERPLLSHELTGALYAERASSVLPGRQWDPNVDPILDNLYLVRNRGF